MRTWGRVNGTWIAVESDATGDFSYGWLTTLIQTIKLNLGESPFYAQYGIPAQQSIVQQVYPDYYVHILQQQFSGYFALLRISRVEGQENPTYRIEAIFFSGVSVQRNVAV